MNFSDAMQHVREGKNVARTSWGREKTFVYMADNSICYQIRAITPCSSVFVTDEYENAIDWEVINDLEIVKLGYLNVDIS